MKPISISTNTTRFAVSAMASLCMSGIAHAEISYSMQVIGMDGYYRPDSQTTPIQTTSESAIQSEILVHGSHASVKADTSTASIGATSSAHRRDFSEPYTYSTATVTLTEHFSFANGSSDQMAAFQYAVDGNLGAWARMTSNDPFESGMGFPMPVRFGQSSVLFSIQLVSDDPAQIPLSFNWGNQSGWSGYWGADFNGSFLMPTAGNWTMTTSLTTNASNDAWAKFGNTAKLYIDTPTGVSLVSSTGFMSNATPLLPVPEPETYTMLLAGLACIGAHARQRQRRQP